MDQKILSRVRALLAQAASTTHDDAEAYQCKAEALMARHAIDQAMLDMADPSKKEEVITRAIVIEGPFHRAKHSLLHVITKHHGCRAVAHPRAKGSKIMQVMVVGHESAVDFCEELFTSLLLHVTNVMLSTPTPPYENTKAFRQAFLLEYCNRINERLETAQATAVKEAEAETGTSVLPMLLDRNAEVETEISKLFPRIRSNHVGSSGRAGGRGTSAANGADLGQRRVKGRMALGAG